MFMKKPLLGLTLVLLLNANIVFGSLKKLDVNDIRLLYNNAAQQSLSHRQKIAYQAKERLTIHGAVYVEIPDETIRTFTFLRNHDRLDCRLGQQQIFRKDKDNDEERRVRHKFQYLISSGRYFNYSLNTEVEIYTSQKDPWKLATTSVSTVGRALDGYIPGDQGKSILEILDEESSVLQLRSSMEEIDGHDTYVLESDTKYGHYNLWVDPNCGFNARRIVVRRNGDDLFRGKPVCSPRPPLPPNAKPAYPYIPYKEVLYVLDSIVIKQYDDSFVPVSAVGNTTYVYENDEVVYHKQEYQRADIDLNPDFEKIADAFTLLVPDGATLWDTDSNKRFTWQQGKKLVEWYGGVRYVPKEWSILVGVSKSLPAFEGIKLNLSAEQVKDKVILYCFFDMNQRPSRNCLLQLCKRAKELIAKDVIVVVIQASKVDDSVFHEWVAKNNIPFPIGRIQGDEEKIRFTWNVESLPWLVLTDHNHVVTAEGFGLGELEDKIRQAGDGK
jgi:hypothetical protein